MTCQGITLSGTKCSRKTNNQYCFQHQPAKNNKYRETKPSKCIICCESLLKQKRALACGHWVHKNCVIQSARAYCPLCRKSLRLGHRAMKKISVLAKQRAAENLAEEEEQLRNDTQDYITQLIAPELQTRILEIVSNLLEDNEDIETNDILQNIFDDDAYQSFLHNIMDIDENQETETDETDQDL